ncbi:hypothetical protein, partial [Gulosibacter molinativorax]|uniref:hypothetical protein n=1 Tax=Gulosibacter molinativorax TaxID=256821 RepID=UPI0024BDA566
DYVTAGIHYSKWADLVATSGQSGWPSAGNSLAAYGQFSMAANNALNTAPRHTLLLSTKC